MPTYTTNPIKITDPAFPIATATFSDLAFLGTQTVSSAKKAQLIPFTLLGLATTATVLQKASNLLDLLDPLAARGNIGAKNLYYVSGTSAPLGTLGILNDYAFNDNGVLYEKTAAAVWTSRIDFVTQAELTAANYLTATAANLLYAPIGENAGPGLRYTYNTSTTFPATTGQILLNAATFAATTSISVHTSDRNSRDFSSILDLGVAGSRLQLTFDGAEETYAWFNITAIATSGSTRTYTVTFIQSNGTPANGEMLLQIVTVGGGSSASGIRLDRTFSTTTTAGPTSGTLRLSNGNPQTTPTIVRINNTRTVGSASADQSSILDKIAVGNIIQVSHSTTGLYATYKVTAVSTSVVSTTTAYNFSCDYLFGTAGIGSWPNNDTVIFNWIPDNGVAAGSTGGATGLKYTYNTTSGTGVVSAADLATATTLTINAMDATTPTAKSSAAVLARFKTGAIIQVAKDDSNWVRYSITSDYASGAVAVTIDQAAGTIASGNTVYISIVSGAPTTGGSSKIKQSISGNATIPTGADVEILTTGATAQSLTVSSSAAALDALTIQGSGAGVYSLVGGIFYAPDGTNNTGIRRLATHRYAPLGLVCLGGVNWAVRYPSNMTGVELFAGGGATYDTDATAYFTAVEATGATLTATQKTNINAIFVGLKANSLAKWNKIVGVYPLAGGTAAAHAINAKTPGTRNLTFTGTNTHNAQGWTTNGTDAVADTGILPSGFTLNRGLMSFSISGHGATNPGIAAGSIAVGSVNRFYAGTTSGTASFNAIAVFTEQATTLATSQTTGSFCFNRNADANYVVAVNGTIVDTKNIAAIDTSSLTNSIRIGALSEANGVSQYFRSATYSMIVIASNGFTNAEIAELATLEENYRAAR